MPSTVTFYFEILREPVLSLYQSGGYMWYAVFNRSMMALIAGVLTLLGYLGIRETFFKGIGRNVNVEIG